MAQDSATRCFARAGQPFLYVQRHPQPVPHSMRLPNADTDRRRGIGAQRGWFGALQVTEDVQQLLDSWRQQTTAAAPAFRAADPLGGSAGYAEAPPGPAAGRSEQVGVTTIWNRLQ